jgi:hypothetical protein
MCVTKRVLFFPVSFPAPMLSAFVRRIERQRARCHRQVIELSVLMLVNLPLGWPQEPPPPGSPSVTLEIKVTLPDHAVFNIPVVGDGEMLSIVPLSHGPFVGIRLIPRTRGDSVHIEVSALVKAKKQLSEATGDEVRSWSSEDAGSYDGKENSSLLLSGLRRLGLPVLEMKIVRAGGPPPGEGLPTGGCRHPYADCLAFCGCAFPKPRSITIDGSSASGVAGVMSYPDAGKCAQVSGCGQCCRMISVTAVQQSCSRSR